MQVEWDMWDFRNSVVHQHDNAEKQARRAELAARIDHEFRLGKKRLLPTDKGLLAQSAGDIKAWEPDDQDRWLGSV